MSEEMIENDASDKAVAHIERVVAGVNRREIDIARAAGLIAARAALSAYNPNERLREALLSARRKFENLAMIAGDGTAVALQSYAEIGGIDEALSPLRQGEAMDPEREGLCSCKNCGAEWRNDGPWRLVLTHYPNCPSVRVATDAAASPLSSELHARAGADHAPGSGARVEAAEVVSPPKGSR